MVVANAMQYDKGLVDLLFKKAGKNMIRVRVLHRLSDCVVHSFDL